MLSSLNLGNITLFSYLWWFVDIFNDHKCGSIQVALLPSITPIKYVFRFIVGLVCFSVSSLQATGLTFSSVTLSRSHITLTFCSLSFSTRIHKHRERQKTQKKKNCLDFSTINNILYGRHLYAVIISYHHHIVFCWFANLYSTVVSNFSCSKIVSSFVSSSLNIVSQFQSLPFSSSPPMFSQEKS